MTRSDRDDSVTLSHMLNRVARLYSSRVVSHLQEQKKLDSVRPVHLVTMMHLTGDGQRITEVADELDVSKQAVKRVVDELEELELVIRTADPSDKRAKIVKLTSKGKKACKAGATTLDEFEESYKADVGDKAADKLWASLNDLADWLEHMEDKSKRKRRRRSA